MTRANRRGPPWVRIAPSDLTSQDSNSDLTPKPLVMCFTERPPIGAS